MKLFENRYTQTIFFINLITVILIAVGFLPREISFISLAILIIYALTSAKEALTLFFSSVPFFIALPITNLFDNFNTWRIVIIVIFIKWFITRINLKESITLSKVKTYFKNNRIEFVSFLILIISIISFAKAFDLIVAGKRIIYFINLAMAYALVKSSTSSDINFAIKLMKSFLVGAVAVAMIGLLQLMGALTLDFSTFHYLWAKQIDLALFGQNWSDIAYQANTWYSYSGNNLKLRVFSIFPDSHSMPIYLIFSLISIYYLFTSKIADLSNRLLTSIKKHDKELKPLFLLFLLIAALIILSQTRGIWLALLAPIIFGIYYKNKLLVPKIIPSVLISSAIIFLLIFIATYSITSLPQFKTSSSNHTTAFISRLFSIGDLNETSNMGRIAIWRSTFISITKNPFLGVGIGNYPVALNQNVALAKAGSSAHNLYLTMIAEIGMLGGLLFIWLCFLFYKQAKELMSSQNDTFKIFGFYFSAMLLWIYFYSLTDAALLDERAFLAFMLFTGITAGLTKKTYAK
ncbi:MAG: hypothetical protein COU81_01945 [Candidatus Portnoybacteria bacterium CG10_big_fil_rev_8_21_14_0_10_36_7]|uniref:O-antigen ligase-related domain-containing protein n=1 Tax=Candidatus Portnoybacteria bacterium CG10_big_fil_rev_8_21_14_0_10_36_7 TaxID=1974812 RepID=A0A2M8KE76_9BACT|nr:MAG: hypothetical protein COU81_01945 [Candidatus Portnoybacteria bacterium CG10_big_fil_rev_8_21_14_0_10_36_7]